MKKRDMDQISVTVNRGLLRYLDAAILEGTFENRSHAVRMAIRRMKENA